MLCAARPASNSTGPFPCTRTATTSPAPNTFSGTDTARASSSIRARLVGTTNVHGCAFLDDPESRPASSTRSVKSAGSASGSVRRSSRRLAIASSVSMPTTLPPLAHRHRDRPRDLSCVAMAQPVDQETVSLLRWLRRQLRQPTPEREHLEAAVANDDPQEARRLLRQYDFGDAQRRHVEGLIDRWEKKVRR